LRGGDRVTALTCAREFYYFWLGDVKKLVEITSRSGFTTRNVRLEMADSLASLLERMQQQGFDAFPPSLEIYLGKLFEDGMPEATSRSGNICSKACCSCCPANLTGRTASAWWWMPCCCT
jgi:hypothetical protein